MDEISENPARYAYDKGENRHKHTSKEALPWVEIGSNGRPIGRCPRGISIQECEELLNKGYGLYYEGQAYPESVYILIEGVPYEAVPTERGKSYHAYPTRELHNIVEKFLKNLAYDRGELRAYKKWMKGE